RDSADNAIVAAVLHLLQHHFPLRVDEDRAQMQPAGNLVDQIDFETHPLAVRDELERRIHEIRANLQNSGRQRLQSRLGMRRREDRSQQQYRITARVSLKAPHAASRPEIAAAAVKGQVLRPTRLPAEVPAILPNTAPDTSPVPPG